LRAGPGLGEVITDIVTAPPLSISIFGRFAAFAFLSPFGAGLQIWTVIVGGRPPAIGATRNLARSAPRLHAD
jgi:hypothetical protein